MSSNEYVTLEHLENKGTKSSLSQYKGTYNGITRTGNTHPNLYGLWAFKIDNFPQEAQIFMQIYVGNILSTGTGNIQYGQMIEFIGTTTPNTFQIKIYSYTNGVTVSSTYNLTTNKWYFVGNELKGYYTVTYSGTLVSDSPLMNNTIASSSRTSSASYAGYNYLSMETLIKWDTITQAGGVVFCQIVPPAWLNTVAVLPCPTFPGGDYSFGSSINADGRFARPSMDVYSNYTGYWRRTDQADFNQAYSRLLALPASSKHYTEARAAKIDNMDRSVVTVESNIRGTNNKDLTNIFDQFATTVTNILGATGKTTLQLENSFFADGTFGFSALSTLLNTLVNTKWKVGGVDKTIGDILGSSGKSITNVFDIFGEAWSWADDLISPVATAVFNLLDFDFSTHNPATNPSQGLTNDNTVSSSRINTYMVPGINTVKSNVNNSWTFTPVTFTGNILRDTTAWLTNFFNTLAQIFPELGELLGQLGISLIPNVWEVGESYLKSVFENLFDDFVAWLISLASTFRPIFESAYSAAWGTFDGLISFIVEMFFSLITAAKGGITL